MPKMLRMSARSKQRYDAQRREKIFKEIEKAEKKRMRKSKLNAEYITFNERHVVPVSLTSFLGGRRPRARAGQPAVQAALDRIKCVERKRLAGGVDIFHVTLEVLPAVARKRLDEAMERAKREAAPGGRDKLTEEEALAVLGPDVLLLEFRLSASVVVHDSVTGKVVFYKLARSPSIMKVLGEHFGGDEDSLAEELFKVREVSAGTTLLRNVEEDAKSTPSHLLGLTAQENWESEKRPGGERARVRSVVWARTEEGREYVEKVVKPLAEAIYAAVGLVLPETVAKALRDLDERFLETPVGEIWRPLGRFAALAAEVNLGVRVLVHHDGKNARSHPSAYLVFHRRGKNGEAPEGGSLIALDYGVLISTRSLDVVGGEFHEVAHASAPSGFATGPLKLPADDEGKPVRGIVIVFTHQACLDYVHTGRWAVDGCQCSGGCPALRARPTDRKKRGAKRERKRSRARAGDEAAAASAGAGAAEEEDASGSGQLRRGPERGAKRAALGVEDKSL
jgi:hypothetical protein